MFYMSYKEFSGLSVCLHSLYIDISVHMNIYEYTYCMPIYIYIYTLTYPFPFSIIFFHLLFISLPQGRKVLFLEITEGPKIIKQNWCGKRKRCQNCRENYWWCFLLSGCPISYSYFISSYHIKLCLLIITLILLCSSSI